MTAILNKVGSIVEIMLIEDDNSEFKNKMTISKLLFLKIKTITDNQNWKQLHK